ncbi:nuclease-related domain-containing protein [Iodobacter fluviatilis]|uniref:Nuclease-like protein n=1 Tax=Iodobacter fluviatilis TaxID=537 RepID=A0A377Q435_9NEIS|nr:nuclease-related domain-containing protein [Iodobacter fluviatilis]TCU84100.1 nuclease-like protein [Iodobacter fluviatilis]STQ89713.1 Nuclease-related domain [Iodobacter fluviatilis]
MIIKSPDSKQAQLDELNALLALTHLSVNQRELITKEMYMLQQGVLGEQNSEYEINFYLKDAKRWAVIHDLRIEHNGRVAQIDHLLINRFLEVFVIETKNFSADLQINELGEFTAWYNKKPIGIPSPLAQNDKHIEVLKALSKTLPLPTRLGLTLMPSFTSVVMVSNKQRITRPKKFDTKNIIKAEQILEWVTKTNVDNASIGTVFGSLAKMVSPETVMDIGELFTRHHRPLTPDYKAKFGIKEPAEVLIQKPEVQVLVQQVVAVAITAEEITKLTSSKLAAKLGLKNTQELIDKLLEKGFVEIVDGKTIITDQGKIAGGEAKFSSRFGAYFIWPEGLIS